MVDVLPTEDRLEDRQFLCSFSESSIDCEVDDTGLAGHEGRRNLCQSSPVFCSFCLPYRDSMAQGGGFLADFQRSAPGFLPTGMYIYTASL